jgi:hypothetical protein
VPRGFVWAAYVDDNGNQWALQVDADYAEDPDRGWFTEGAAQLPPFPRRWKPRYVEGIDESGRIQTARVGHVGAALWAGTVLAFVFETSNPDQNLAVADVIRKVQEKRRGP